jgi:hypothetical protein
MKKPELTFDLPLPPNLNASGWGGRHWRRTKAQEDYYDQLDLLLAIRRLPPRPRRRIKQAEAVATLRSCPVMDQDNAHRRMKWVWDWLQSRGYIVNDREVRCELTPVASGRKNQGITLIIEERTGPDE